MGMVNKVLHWGPFPNELDGGAVVNFYQWRQFNEMYPLIEQYAICKNIDELNPEAMPYIQFLWNEDKDVSKIANFMTTYQIPIVEAFHIAENIDLHVRPVHECGGKIILWQTIHWQSDRVFESRFLNVVDSVVAPTKFAADMLTIYGKVDREHITIIPHGVDTRLFRPHPTLVREHFRISQTQPIILYCGRLDMWKGVQNLIPSIKPLINDYDAVFIIRGCSFKGLNKSVELGKLFSILSHKDPRHIIFLPDWQTPEFMEELMASCDIYVSNSGHEGFNVPLIEAMGCAKPVISTALPNHIEILDGTNNILIPPTVKVGMANDDRQEIKVGSHDALFGALKTFLDNPSEAAYAGECGRKKVLENYSLEDVCVKWNKLMNSMLPENYDMDIEMSKRMLIT